MLNLAAGNPHGRLEVKLLHYTFKRSVAARAANIEPPEDLNSPGRILVGAQHYDNVCSKCHGGPELGQNPVALSMRPRPQHLPAVVDQFTDSEIFWILENGVKFSAMPAWPTPARKDEIWSVVAFLRQLEDMTADEYAELVQPPLDADLPPMPYEDPGPLLQSDVRTNTYPEDEYLYAVPATEWPRVAKGGHPAAECATCHGVNGSGAATLGEAPNLTIQSPEYLAATLRDYATAERKSGIMQVVAAGLTQEQMAELALYYADMPDVRSASVAASPELLEEGRELALYGRPEDGVVACVTCHQQPEVPGTLMVPRLAGQSPVYLRRQLTEFLGDGRGQTGVYNPMPYVAHDLSDGDIAALAAYFAALDPVENRIMMKPQPEVDLAAAEEVVADVCAECHTLSGVGVESGEYPNLTLQTSEYLTKQLHAFRNGTRVNSQMNNTARFIGAEQVPDLAAYWGARPPVKLDVDIDPEAAERGAEIVMAGLPDDDVPACLTCHSAENTVALPLVARLHGQNPTYLQERLDYFAGRDIDEQDEGNPMYGIATALSEEQRADVAAWFAAQEPLPKARREALNAPQ